MKFRLTLAATLLLGALPLTAHAQSQPWLADRQYGEGIGARVGDLELHPGISGEVGYDSNYFLRAPQETPIAAYRFRVTPSISLETLGSQRRLGVSPAGPAPLQFNADAYVSLNELIAADSKYSSDVSDQRHVDAGGDLTLNLFPAGRLGGDAYLNAVRMVQPSNDTNTEDAFDRDSLRAGAGVTWRPGGGLFDWRLGYEILYNFFEDDPFKDLNNFQNQVNMRGRWRFLPRTALLYNGSYTWINYSNNDLQSNGSIVRSQIGLNGLVTNRFALLGLIGWAGTFYDGNSVQPRAQFDSLTAQAELKWFLATASMDQISAPVGLSWVALGYVRDVQNSYLGDFYQRDRGYLQLSYLLGGVFVGSLNGGVARLAFPESASANGTGTPTAAFNETRVDASLFGEYRLSNTVGVNATINYLRNFTDKHIPDDPVPVGVTPDYLAFEEWQAFLGVRWFL